MLSIRPATPDDYSLFTRLFRELGTDDPVMGPVGWEREMVPATLIAERNGRPVGYAFYQLLSDTGYVRHLVSAPEARRAGVGRALMEELRTRFRAAGARWWCLNVKPNNVPALSLYESLGLRAAYRSTALRFSWSLVERLPRVSGVEALPIPPEDDHAVEPRMHLVRGQLADARSRGRVLVQLRRGAAVVGAAIFEPGFPGAFPFRVAAPELCGALLLGLRPHARPEHSVMQVVAEDDAALAALLQSAGAEVRLETVHYRGSPVEPRGRPER